MQNEELKIKNAKLALATLGLWGVCAVVSLAGAETVPAAVRTSAVGGGYANAGLKGEYFANPDLAGTPAFVRYDARIDFDWSNGVVGGSTAEPYHTFPAEKFSVRWTGQILPRYSGTYGFFTGKGVQLKIGDGDDILDTWTRRAKKFSNAFTFTAGKLYDIEVRYHYQPGETRLVLSWILPISTSPVPTDEVIDVASGLATNVYNDGFADAMTMARDEWIKADGNAGAARDENGWPKEDAKCMLWEGVTNRHGKYFLQFNGKADLSTQGGYTKFLDQKYDPAANLTTAVMHVQDAGFQNFNLVFKNTCRDAKSPPNTGVTNIKLMVPTAVGADTWYPAGTLFVTPLKDALRRFTALRFMAGTNWNNSITWFDRTRIAYATQRYARPGESGFESNGMAWEYRVMLCNETGKDLYVCIPATANDDYITKLAQLIKYGSDGVNPYTQPQAKPVYPPLNSNLRVYVEFSNEVWNVGFQAWHQNFDAAQKALKDKTDEGKILAYDGNTDANVIWNRRYALQTVRASNLFRAVFGDAAIGACIRPLIEWQYDNSGWPPGAEMELTFLDDYFNNGDGKPHVATPHPVSYYLWGGGGAAYYGAQNELGLTALLPDGGFEKPAIADQQAAPVGAGWTFTGTAGIAHNGSALGNPDAPIGEGEGKKVPNLQSGYLKGTASMSFSFAAPGNQTSKAYALAFKAVQRKPGGSAPGQMLDVYADDKKINKPNTWQGYYQPDGGWRTFNTDVFFAEPGSKHVLKFVGLSDNAESIVFIDDVVVTSADAIFAADVPAACANNEYEQGASLAGYEKRLRGTANWAKLYGLAFVAYEGGWALGGDGGGSAIQNYAKFNDPRTRQAHMKSIDSFYQTGGDLYVFGTYSQWDACENADKEPLPQGIDESNKRLPVSPTNGVVVPAELTPAKRLTEYGVRNKDTGDGGKVGPNTLLAWNIFVPVSGVYSMSATTQPGGEARVIVDGTVAVASGAGGAELSGKVSLTHGLHNLRVRAMTGGFVLSGVAIKKSESRIQNPEPRINNTRTPPTSGF